MSLNQTLSLTKMYIRVSSLTIVRAGRKCSKTSTIVSVAVLCVAFFFLLALMTDHRIGETDFFYRQSQNKMSVAANIVHRFTKKVQKVHDDSSSFTRMKTTLSSSSSVELPTWSINQSLSIDDYIDLNNPNTFILQPSLSNGTSSYCGPGVNILIIVTSAASNFEQRRAIRETWGNKEEELWDKGVRIAFILGNSGNETVEEQLTKEFKFHGDIIQEDFFDSYHNLTLKSMSMLKWVNLTCFQNNSYKPEFLLKTDDDIFINVDRLLQVARDMPNAKMIGRLTCGAVPIADLNSKLYMPKYIYAGRVYPGYLSGTAYLLRNDMIPILLHNAASVSLIHLEDIYITGLLARQSRIYPDDSPFFTYNRIDPKDPCAFHYMVNSHQMTPQEIRTIYTSLKRPTPGNCGTRKQKWARRIPRMNKRIKNLCKFV